MASEIISAAFLPRSAIAVTRVAPLRASQISAKCDRQRNPHADEAEQGAATENGKDDPYRMQPNTVTHQFGRENHAFGELANNENAGDDGNSPTFIELEKRQSDTNYEAAQRPEIRNER